MYINLEYAEQPFYDLGPHLPYLESRADNYRGQSKAKQLY